jgi:uncharacterized protein with NRDE domain
MCILALAWQLLPNCPVLLLSNRDEFHNRPATPLHIWPDQHIVAGQDVASHGTWLGLNQTTKKWAVVTNYREGGKPTTLDQQSRGLLITQYLNSDLSPMAFAQALPLNDYAGFNLIVGDLQQAVVCSNRGTAPTVLGSGLYTLSNGLISDSWPKMERLRLRTVQEILPLMAGHQVGQPIPQTLLDAAWQVLQDEQKAQDIDLPHTGISTDMEKLLSSIFIQSPIYGTRVSNVMLLDSQGYDFVEKTHVPIVEQVLSHQTAKWNSR